MLRKKLQRYYEDYTGNKAVIDAESLTDALKVITANSLDQAQAERLRRIQLKRAEQTAQEGVLSNVNTPVLHGISPSILVASRQTAPETVADKLQVSLEDIASFYYEGDALSVLPQLASQQIINHIICDPPYGINMDNLSGQAISRVEETHEVAWEP